MYAILLYLPESTAVKNGNILGKASIIKINFKFIFEIIAFVWDLFILEKKIEIIKPKKPNRKIGKWARQEMLVHRIAQH